MIREGYDVDVACVAGSAAIPTQGWIRRGRTIRLKTNSGRNRLNILGAYSPDDRSLISLEGRESCDAGRVVQSSFRSLYQIAPDAAIKPVDWSGYA